MKTAIEVPQTIHLYAHFCDRYVSCHCVKSAGIRSFFGPYFPAFRLNTDRWFAFLCILSKYGKIRIRKNPNTDTFHAVCVLTCPSVHYSIPVYTLTILKVIQRKTTNTVCYVRLY